MLVMVCNRFRYLFSGELAVLLRMQHLSEWARICFHDFIGSFYFPQARSSDIGRHTTRDWIIRLSKT